MKDLLITTLRDKNTTQGEYRSATEKLAFLLAVEVGQLLPKDTFPVPSPMGPAEGYKLKHNVVLVPVLRSGLALLYPFMRYYPNAKVGFVGMKRDEKTAEAHNYYINLPHIDPEDTVIVLEPMLATGGSGAATIEILKNVGVKEDKILTVHVIAAPEGIQLVRSKHPNVRIHIAQVDETLNEKKFIVPGLGDFGDRYFGTES